MDRYTVQVTLISLLLAALSYHCEGTTGSEAADYKTLVSLCIAIIILFSTWLIVLVVIVFYYCRYHFRTWTNRNAVSHTDQLNHEVEMIEWDSVPGAITLQSPNLRTVKRYNRSTQTVPLLIESLVTPERPSNRLPPISTQ